MAQKSTIRKSLPRGLPDSNNFASAGKNGISLAPPAAGPDDGMPVQRKTGPARVGNGWDGYRQNRTGLPDNLKTGVESLSGLSLEDVQVHYNSPKPAQLQALAYTQGTQIHVGPGQERYLPHEAWHVVQQKQRRVIPTFRFNSRIPINNSPDLEKEADLKGREVTRWKPDRSTGLALTDGAAPLQNVIQRHIKEVKTSPLGKLRIDMEARNPRILDNSRAGEYGTISFMPGDEAPNTSKIYLEQLANFEDLSKQFRLPDFEDIALMNQKTIGKNGGETGFVIDQLVSELDKEFSDELQGGTKLKRPERFAYALTGDLAQVSLIEIMKAIAKGQAPDKIEKNLYVSRYQVMLIKEWIQWARDIEHFLGDKLTLITIQEAMIKTVMKKDVNDDLLSGATGIDTKIWHGIREIVEQKRWELEDELEKEPSVADVAKEFKIKDAKIQRDTFGMKKNEIRHPASLYDTPSSKQPGKWDFKTAPIDTDTGLDMGMYVRWGFQVKQIKTKTGFTAGVDPQSEYSKIEFTKGSTYQATAREAREKFDTYWRAQNPQQFLPPLPPLHRFEPSSLPRRDIQPPLPPWLEPSALPQVPLNIQPRSSLLSPGIEVIDYKEGQQGVFFVQDDNEIFVAKPLYTAMNEALTLKLATQIGILQPETDIILLTEKSSKGAAAREVIGAIQKSKYAKEYNRVFEKLPPRFLMKMKLVRGVSLGKAHKEQIDYGDPEQLINDIGLIAAFDTLIHYQDRTSIIGGGNLENLMIENQKGSMRGIAIDQRTRVTRREPLYGLPHLEGIEIILKQIKAGDQEPLERLWADLPEALHTILAKKGNGLDVLQTALTLGFKQIANRLNDESIEIMSKSVQGLKMEKKPSSSVFSLPDTDTVDVIALKDSLALVKKYFG